MDRNVRTDLALESRENLEMGEELSGVEVTVEEDENLGIIVTWVEIINKEGALSMGKPIGNYITLESSLMRENDPDSHEEIVKILARKLGQLHRLGENSTVLVVGLGNRYVTPDALGPQVCENLLVTRHLEQEVPPDLKLRAVSALAPGVMGITGIETAEIIKGVVDRIKPDIVIAVDALAARKTSRINTTIQMSDAGVNPGAGLGNKRMPINKESMGVPVLAIGVPTVVDAVTLVNDTLDKMLGAMLDSISAGHPFFEMLNTMQDEERHNVIGDILSNNNMFVTPKEIDAVVTRLAKIIANTLNIALHPGITQDDVNRYLV